MSYLTTYDTHGHVLRDRSFALSVDAIGQLTHPPDALILNLDHEPLAIFAAVPQRPIIPHRLSTLAAVRLVWPHSNPMTFVVSINPPTGDTTTLLHSYHVIQKTLLQTWTIDSDCVSYLCPDNMTILALPSADPITFFRQHLRERRDIVTFTGHTGAIMALSVLESAHRVASSSQDGTVKLWDLTRGHCLATLPVTEYAEEILLVNADVVVGWRGVPALWVGSVTQQRFFWTADTIDPVVVVPSGEGESLLVGDSDGHIRCYTLTDGTIRWSQTLQPSRIYAIISDPQHSLIIVGDGDGCIWVLDAQSGQPQRMLVGHQGSVSHLVPVQQRYLWSGGLDETIRLWDLVTGQCLAILIGHIHRIQAIVTLADARYLVSCDHASHVIAWEIDWTRIIRVDTSGTS
jgi:WD40 repeat protein